MRWDATQRLYPVAIVLMALIAGFPGMPASAAPINLFPYNREAILAVPYVTIPEADRNGETVQGTVSLQTQFFNRYGHTIAVNDLRYAYTLNGRSISPILNAGDSFNWDTTNTADGGHAIGMVIVDGAGSSTDLRNYRAYSTGFYVQNQPGPVTGPVRIPTFGNTFSSVLLGSTPDYLTVDPTSQLPGATPAPLTPVYTAPVSQQTGRFADPLDAHGNANWFVEPLTQSNTGLYQGDPGLYLTRDGNPMIRNFYPQITDDSTESADGVLRQNTRPGERNDNLVSPYATYTPIPDGPGYYGVDLAGWIYKVDETGKVTTIAGREVIPDVIPYDFNDKTIDQQQLADHQVRWVGDFGHEPGHGHGGQSGADAVVPCKADHIHKAPPLCNPHDIVVDPRDSKVLYVADTDNHVITKIDMNMDPPKLSIFAGTKQTAGDDNGETTTKFNRPTSITMADDGTMYVADNGNNAIKKIAPDGTVTTLTSGLDGPFVVRLDSAGDIVFGENPSSKIKRLDIASNTITEIADGFDSNWVWLDVDRKGNVGPVDDILFATATGGANNAHMYRVSKNGDRIDEFLPNQNTRGSLNQGPADVTGDGHGHYPWVLTIDDEEAKILTHGFGNVGLRTVRLRNEDDPTSATYNHSAYRRGQDVFRNGSALGFPVDARPSFTALRGQSGHNLIGLPTFDELALYEDQALADYIRGGFGGAVPRPEITCGDMDALIYYIRMNSLLAQSQTVAVGNSCEADPLVPEVSEINYGWTPNGFQITWNTDKETIGYVAHGVSDVLHRWSDIEDGFGTEHSIYLDTLPEDGTEIQFSIYVRDAYGNIVITGGETTVIQREIFVGMVPAPGTALLFGCMAAFLMIRRRRLIAH